MEEGADENEVDLSVDRWFNVPRPPDLTGKALLLYTFQMLCPNCVNEATPLAKRVYPQLRGGAQLIGLHTVFENHEAQSNDPLAHYIARSGITFPVAVDRSDGTDDAPVTMRRLKLQGTPGFVTIDRRGEVRERLFGVPAEDWLLTRMNTLTVPLA